MSRFFSDKYRKLEAYVPGEQPRDRRYIKLNTNENPFLPHPAVTERTAEAAGRLQLYSDPECTALRQALGKSLGVKPEEVLPTNGSDEILNFAFMAFCDESHPAVFADITYGFYPVFAEIDQVPFREIPLRADYSIAPEDYYRAGGTVFIANPNAPTGLALGRQEIRGILENNPENVVVIDEAYVDFGAESCVPLIREYPNLLVTQTFSKSRSLAGMRLGFGVGCEELIRDLKTVQYSTNPYNVDSLAQAAGIACLEQAEYTEQNVRTIMATREKTAEEMKKLGFILTDSKTNFLFAEHPLFPGDSLYRKLKERGILIRHFSAKRIENRNRITVGSGEQMEILLSEIRKLMEEMT